MTENPMKAVADYLDRAARMETALNGIAVLFGLDTWDDLPDTGPHGLLEEVEKSVAAREMKSFLRGLRAGNVASGKDPDELPESPETITSTPMKTCEVSWGRIFHSGPERPIAPFLVRYEGKKDISFWICKQHSEYLDSEHAKGMSKNWRYARPKPLSSAGHNAENTEPNLRNLSSTGETSGGIFDVIDRAVANYWNDLGGIRNVVNNVNVVVGTVQSIKLALQKASAEELQLRVSSTGQGTGAKP